MQVGVPIEEGAINGVDRTFLYRHRDLAWIRTRGWRGQRAAAGAGRTISVAVAASAVLSLRNLLDDITAWGWQQAPPRRLVFALA
jgi:hypothetical protein